VTSPADDPYLPDEAAGTAPGRARLTGRRILVVGAGTRPCPDPDPPMGNGRAISVLAAREGAAVACADKDRDAAQETARLARAEGGTAQVLVADVAEPQACADLVTAAAAALGGLDGLVLNVGFALGRGITGTTAQEWDDVFAVNTRAHFLVSAAALPVLAPRSSIVYISSAASLRAATGAPSYDASKAALLGICRPGASEGPADPGQPGRAQPGRHAARPGRVPAEPGPHRAAPSVRPPGHRLGGRLRGDLAALG